jgi:hypothetical protein
MLERWDRLFEATHQNRSRSRANELASGRVRRARIELLDHINFRYGKELTS